MGDAYQVLEQIFCTVVKCMISSRTCWNGIWPIC
jgi:hypothetical protein